jgi:hypothetical protein
MAAIGKAFEMINSGLQHLVPKGGVKHPDSVIRKDHNRGLYIPDGKMPKLIPGEQPKLNRHLLTGRRPKRLF